MSLLQLDWYNYKIANFRGNLQVQGIFQECDGSIIE
jgi:hypothetical protein